MKFKKTKGIPKNKRVKLIEETVIVVLIIAIVGTIIIHNNLKDEDTVVQNKKVEVSKEIENPDDETEKEEEIKINFQQPEPDKPIVTIEPEPQHTHNWIALTKEVEHEATGHYENEVKEAWDENTPVYEEVEVKICDFCGAQLDESSVGGHIEEHISKGESASVSSKFDKVEVRTETVHHDAVVEEKWVVDEGAWTETVDIGRKCNECGETEYD